MIDEAYIYSGLTHHFSTKNVTSHRTKPYLLNIWTTDKGTKNFYGYGTVQIPIIGVICVNNLQKADYLRTSKSLWLTVFC